MRTLSLVSLLAALAVGGSLLSAQWRTSGPTSPTESPAAVIDAGGGLEQHRVATGSYAGAQLGGFGVVLRSADAGSYCVETLRAPVLRLAGPGGTAAAGSC